MPSVKKTYVDVRGEEEFHLTVLFELTSSGYFGVTPHRYEKRKAGTLDRLEYTPYDDGVPERHYPEAYALMLWSGKSTNMLMGNAIDKAVFAAGDLDAAGHRSTDVALWGCIPKLPDGRLLAQEGERTWDLLVCSEDIWSTNNLVREGYLTLEKVPAAYHTGHVPDFAQARRLLQGMPVTDAELALPSADLRALLLARQVGHFQWFYDQLAALGLPVPIQLQIPFEVPETLAA